MARVEVAFKDIKPGDKPLVDHGKYAAVYERTEKLKPGRGFRATFVQDETARTARLAVLKFAAKHNIRITTSVLQKTLEVVRREEEKKQ